MEVLLRTGCLYTEEETTFVLLYSLNAENKD